MHARMHTHQTGWKACVTFTLRVEAKQGGGTPTDPPEIYVLRGPRSSDAPTAMTSTEPMTIPKGSLDTGAAGLREDVR